MPVSNSSTLFGYALDPMTEQVEESLRHQVFFADRAAFADATDLITRFGPAAGREAKLRASRCRDLGNVIHFCRWREIERMIGAMSDEAGSGRLH